MNTKKTTKTLNVPNLRFPGFEGEWEMKYGNELFESVSDKEHNSDLPILAITQEYGAVPRDLIDYKISVTEKSIESYKVVRNGDFIISLRSFQGGIEYSNYNGICSPAYIILRSIVPIEKLFYKAYLKTDKYILRLNKKLEGIRDGKMISYKYFSEIALPVPSIDEQTKIAQFLNLIDNRIQTQNKIIEHLESLMFDFREKLFNRQLRFKNFDGRFYLDWETIKLGDIAEKRITKNVDGKINLVFTNSANQGIVNQRDYFQKDIANQNNLSGYYVVSKDDFVYNPRISTAAPVGPISRNYLETGVMSPLYSVFRITKGDLGYIECFFNSTSWYGHMKKISNSGVRDDRMSFLIHDFYKMPIPFPEIEEQQKIAKSLTKLKEKIETEKKILAAYETQKKYLLQNLFI